MVLECGVQEMKTHNTAIVLTIAATPFISSCAQDNIYGCCVGQSVVGNSSYVTVANVYNEMDALQLAERHCAQHQKTARFKHMEHARAIFDCV